MAQEFRISKDANANATSFSQEIQLEWRERHSLDAKAPNYKVQPISLMRGLVQTQLSASTGRK